MALPNHIPQEETVYSLYSDILNNQVAELPSPTQDILVPVPGDGKCGWWTLALNFNILLTCGYLDQFITTNAEAYLKLLSCVNTIHTKIAQQKGEAAPRQIDSMAQLKKTLLKLNDIEDNCHGASLTAHQKFMAPALKLFLYTKKEYYEASIEKTRFWGSADSLAADPDNHAIGFMTEKFAIARILREEEHREAGIHEWVAVEDMYLLYDLGLQAHVSRHPSIPELTFQSAYDYISKNQINLEKNTPPQRSNSPIHNLKNLREEYDNQVLKADGKIMDSGSVLMKAVLTGNSLNDMPTYGGAESSLNSESDMHFWAKMPLAIYKQAKSIGLVLPNFREYFAIHVGNAHKHLQNTITPLPKEDKIKSTLSTSLNTLTSWLPSILLFALVNAVLVTLQLTQVAFALTSSTVIILTVQNIFSFNSNNSKMILPSTPVHSDSLTAGPNNIESDLEPSFRKKLVEAENEHDIKAYSCP